MRHLIFLVTIMLFGYQAKAFVIGGDHAGNGGNEVGLEFESSFRQALIKVAAHKIEGLESIVKIDYDIRLRDLKILVVDEPLQVTIDGQTQECVAINYPDQKAIRVSSIKWKALDNPWIREGIALHEVLSLLGFESTGQYRYSARYISNFSQDPQFKFTGASAREAVKILGNNILKLINMVRCQDTYALVVINLTERRIVDFGEMYPISEIQIDPEKGIISFIEEIPDGQRKVMELRLKTTPISGLVPLSLWVDGQPHHLVPSCQGWSNK